MHIKMQYNQIKPQHHMALFEALAIFKNIRH